MAQLWQKRDDFFLDWSELPQSTLLKLEPYSSITQRQKNMFEEYETKNSNNEINISRQHDPPRWNKRNKETTVFSFVGEEWQPIESIGCPRLIESCFHFRHLEKRTEKKSREKGKRRHLHSTSRWAEQSNLQQGAVDFRRVVRWWRSMWTPRQPERCKNRDEETWLEWQTQLE